MSFVAYLVIILPLTGCGAFALRKFRLDERLNLFETSTCALFIGGLVNYAIIESIGRWSLTWWSIGCAYVVLLPLAILGWRDLYPRWRSAFAAMGSILNVAGPLFKLQAAALMVLATAGAVQAFAPPNTYDTLNYHLFLPLYDAARGFNGPRWDYNTIFSFHPSYMAHLTRTALVFGTASTAQLINATFVILAAAGAANLVLYICRVPNAAAFAALVTLSNRAVTWQLPSLEVDATIGSFAAMAAALLVKLNQDPNRRLAVIAGIAMGCGALTKYHGFAVAVALGLAFLLVHLRSGHLIVLQSVRSLSIVAGTAAIVVMPHFVRNYLLIGDPLYPLLDLSAAGYAQWMGTGRGILDLLAAPVLIGLVPRSFFDGMMFGAPLLLALFPLSAFVRPITARLASLWFAAAIYYLIWFYALSQQTRFLLPILPILAALSALGASYIGQRLDGIPQRLLVVGILGLMGVQSAFVGVYALLRLPVAIGLMSTERFFQTPTFNGTLYEECRYVSERLGDHGRILALTFEGLAYCPPFKTDYALSVMKSHTGPTSAPFDIETWIERAKTRYYEFVIVRISRIYRGGTEWSSMIVDDYGGESLDCWFQRAVETVEPVKIFGEVQILSGPNFIASVEQVVASGLVPRHVKSLCIWGPPDS
jgi:hypothetical protein